MNPRADDTEYEVWCAGEYSASSTSLAEALRYAALYEHDNTCTPVEVWEVRKVYTRVSPEHGVR